MQPKEAVTYMMNSANKSMYTVSLETGHKASYVSSLMRRKGSISAPVLANIAYVCGYDLALINRETGEQIAIDIPVSE